MKLSVHSLSEAGGPNLLPNDDRVYTAASEGLFVVADARGPFYGGWHEPVRVEAGWQAIHAAWRIESAEPIEERLRRAMLAGNAAMFAGGWPNVAGAQQHPAAEVTALAIAGGRFALVQVGNVRAYLARAGTLSLLSNDRAVAQLRELAEAGLPEDLLERLATRVLGLAPEISIEATCGPVLPDDVFLVCSDGVWRHMAERELAATLAEAAPEVACARILQGARLSADQDDRTALVLRVKAKP